MQILINIHVSNSEYRNHHHGWLGVAQSSCKTLVTITGASHCQFASSNVFCNIGESTCTPTPTISRATQQATAFALLLPWLDYQLKNETAQGNAFQQLVTAASGISTQQNCSLASPTSVSLLAAENSMRMYPNPMSDELTIRTTQALSNATLRLYNGLGQELRRIDNIDGYELKLSRADLPKGIYFVHLMAQQKLLAVEKLTIVD